MAYLVACCRDKSGLHMVEYDGTDWPAQLVTGFARIGCSIFLLLLFWWWWKESLRPLPFVVGDDEVKMLFEDVDKALLSFRRNFALLFWNQTYEKRSSKSLIQNAFLCMLFCTNEYKMGQLSVKPGHNMLFSMWNWKKKILRNIDWFWRMKKTSKKLCGLFFVKSSGNTKHFLSLTFTAAHSVWFNRLFGAKQERNKIRG